MKSRIWRLASVGLLCVSVGAQALADEPQNRGPDGGGRGPEHQGNNQGHGGGNQQRGQDNPQRQNNDIIRGDNSRQFEHNGQQNHGQPNNGQWQNQNQPRPAYNPNPVHSRHRRRNCRPMICRSSRAPTPCARLRNPVRDTTATNARKTATTRTGRPVTVPTITAGRGVRTGMATAGALARNTGRAM